MPTRETPWTAGTPNWIELNTPDPDAARDFYAELFGWHFDIGPAETHHYASASLDGYRVAGVNGMPFADRPPFWTTYLATDDADATQAAIAAAGGTIVMPVMDVMDLGRMTLAEAPGGGFFGAWQAGSHPGFGRFNEHGAVAWNEFITRDYPAAQRFYADVFGYTYTEMGEDGGRYAMIKVADTPVGGIGDMPPGTPDDVPPHWQVYFAVDNCDEMVASAEKLGGTTVSPPTDMPYGRYADVADPQGGRFLVLTPPAG